MFLSSGIFSVLSLVEI